MKSGLTVTKDLFKHTMQSFGALGKTDVLVGVPAEDAERKELGAINNAALAYIHNFGAPESHIPARPFMYTGIKNAQAKIITEFKKVGQAAFDANEAGVQKGLNAAGLAASTAIQNVISAGIAPPLSDRYLRERDRKLLARARAQKGMIPELYGAIREAQLEGRTPLVDTGQLLKAITYVVRKK